MLRPATPLTIIFLVAFVLELLSTLSTPIIHAIPLGSYQGYNFGVFGYCNGNQCSPYQIGYSTGLFSGTNSDDFSLSSSTRHSLSSILIVHPISALLTLICLGLAIATHFHSPSSSPRYLLALLILTIPTLLITLLAFLVDILLFVPHMQWGGWIMLGATILIIASSVMTCAMRRTLVSRKARKKRIAENADMNGANYYNDLNQNRLLADSQMPRADSPPPMSGTTAVNKDMSDYAAFEMKRQNTGPRSRDGDNPGMIRMDDRAPLNPTSNRDPSIRSRAASEPRRPYAAEEMGNMPMGGRPSMDSQRRRQGRDQYGNPLPPGMEVPPPGLRHHGSQGSLGSNGSRSRGRGRGGYGPPSRGYGYGPPGGGYGPPRGGYGSRGGYRGNPPPPVWSGRGRGGYGPPGSMRGPSPQGMRGPSPQGRPGPPPGYANNGFYAGGAGVAAGLGAAVVDSNGRSYPDRGQSRQSSYRRSQEMPIGQAIEMDERTGSAPAPIQPNGENFSPNYGNDQRSPSASGRRSLDERGMSQPTSPTSLYSEQPYMSPRQQWQQPGLSQQPIMPSQRNMAMDPSPHPSSPALTSGPRHQRAPSEPYYEDVDPRFAVLEPSDDGYNRDSALPTTLTPGGHINPGGTTPSSGTLDRMMTPNAVVNSTIPGGYPSEPGAHTSYGFPNRMPAPQHNPDYLYPAYPSGGQPANNFHSSNNDSRPVLETNNSTDMLADGSSGGGSERASEGSHFTSISQRPVNPNWRGSMSGGVVSPSAASAAQRRRDDAILTANPDFSIPGIGTSSRNRAGSRAATAATNVGGGLTPMGRYPTDL